MGKPSQQPIPKSLAETHASGMPQLFPESVHPGRGCLLQIYPARVNAEMIRLSSRRTLMGRDLSCDVTLEDNAASRTHAAIDADEQGYLVIDLGSTNGTYVDDEIVQDRRRLKGGELIRLGNTILKFMSSIDEEAQYHAVVHELMTRDPLTNAFNRAYLIPALEQGVLRSIRQQSGLCIILMDIDHFKVINDSHGHLTGDEVLRIFCERIRGCLRQGDVLARLGGEEFLVLVESMAIEEARRMAERIRLVISSHPFVTQAGEIPVTCSIGVTALSPESTICPTVDQLLSAADHLLYAAKAAGRNNVQAGLRDSQIR
ncbi:MAG: GGDEF domain-containing protein [Planctomyces sp.]|nr:GGDEF domain-containing protein [Planctomyces sp.]